MHVRLSNFMVRTLTPVVATCLCVSSPCSGQPATVNEHSTPVESGTIEPTGVGSASSSSGVVYPQKIKPGSAPKMRNHLDSGSPSQSELAAINRIEIPAGFAPRKAIAHYIENIASKSGPPILQMARLHFIESSALYAVLPDTIFYSLRFPQWPIGFDVPAPLQNNNIFAINKSAKLELLTNERQLEKLFREHMRPAKDGQAAREATFAWLVLGEELAQDGMYQFLITESEIKIEQTVSGIISTGKAVAKPVGGNSGEITAKLSFDSQGHLQSAHQSVNLQAGMRPICQSTKLLDPDPIVRRMAEQDLLIMGSMAKEYLDEQRKKVSPELQQEIDRVWKRIQLEGR